MKYFWSQSYCLLTVGGLPDYIIKKAGYDLFLEDEEESSNQALLERAE